MVLTVDVPKRIHQWIESEKRRTGLSKSDIVRQILKAHYAEKKEVSHA